ncbi:hypothetical protein H1C71_028779 [Ictidomys tridecemlineatus]|nr:hypothetical protein H1C71_028779 [Ictidomys tridecemlineatus]
MRPRGKTRELSARVGGEGSAWPVNETYAAGFSGRGAFGLGALLAPAASETDCAERGSQLMMTWLTGVGQHTAEARQERARDTVWTFQSSKSAKLINGKRSAEGSPLRDMTGTTTGSFLEHVLCSAWAADTWLPTTANSSQVTS